MTLSLKQKRRSLHLTIGEVADAVGVGRTAIQSWENGGASGMKVRSLLKYAQTLQINPMSIIDPDYKKDTDKTIELTVEAMKHLSENRKERVFGFALAQLKEDDNEVIDNILDEK